MKTRTDISEEKYQQIDICDEINKELNRAISLAEGYKSFLEERIKKQEERLNILKNWLKTKGLTIEDIFNMPESENEKINVLWQKEQKNFKAC